MKTSLRGQAEFPILEFLRTRTDAVHNDDVELYVAKTFKLNRSSPAVKDNIRQEVSFSLSRLAQLHLVKHDGGFVRLTDEGRTLSKERLAVLDADLVRKQREARK